MSSTKESPDQAQNDQDLTVGQAMAKTLKAKRKGYKAVKSATGKPSLHCDDPVAKRLEGKTPEEVMALAEKLLDGIEKGELNKRYAHLNIGQKRMNSGNLLRQAIKRGELKASQIK